MLFFLTGFMCCGKTTDGAAAAEILRLPFFDLDYELEKQTGMSIDALIEKKGLDEFRRLESSLLVNCPVLLNLQQQATKSSDQPPSAIIATGGGSVLSAPNREYFSQTGNYPIWLHPPFALLLLRCQAASRPLLSGLTEYDISQIYQERLPHYQNTARQILTEAPFTNHLVKLISALL
jgi:shikimate kinase